MNINEMIDLLESKQMKTITLLEDLGLDEEAEKIIIEREAKTREENKYFKEEEIKWRQEKNKKHQKFMDEFLGNKLNKHWESRLPKIEITDAMIHNAKKYPIENIVKVNSTGFAVCVDHEDSKPSMYCKNNYAYCFTCEYKADAIALYRKVHHKSFKQAVKEMQ